MKRETKTSIVRFFNMYGLREYLMLMKHGKISFAPAKKPTLISTIDEKRNTQGLSDRFRGIISIYALSKATDTTFRLIYTHPFLLTEFLVPNEYNWVAEENELSESIFGLRYKILRKNPTIRKLIKFFPLKKQIRIYSNYSYLSEINRIYNQNYKPDVLFHELFKPTIELEEQLRFHREKIGGKYISCVFRFQSLLGDFKEYNKKPLKKEEQKILIEKNKLALMELIEKNNCPVLVTSDSMRFVSEIKNLKHVYTLPGKVVHLDCSFDEEKEVYMKSFIDFLMISNSEKVYSIRTKEMYLTGFPEFSAEINNVPFERIE